ncbi:UPAR/Ly6 domain-containing protein crok-like [Lineus longissimus]|uniref:UPAR/Ly6 domain-containing protein crok-like n=1 Tax=Lineus longissimus TaxID=88925 RepID=UPI00315D5056
MKQILLTLGSVLGFVLILHLDIILAQTVDSSNPTNVNVGVPKTVIGGIRCFDCNSFYSPSCADWFNNQTWNLEPCGQNVTMCRKMIQEAYFDGAWNVRYIRQCAEHGEVGADEGRRCIERAGMYRVKMRYCHCDNKDGCNSASSVKMSLAMILPLSLGLLICKYFSRLL